MKSVIISIQPQWIEKIAKGTKTIEVRKTRPKIDTPFKCYIYCTKGKDLWRTQKGVKSKTELAAYLMNGKVIGEFVCDRIIELGNYQEVDHSYMLWVKDQQTTKKVCNNACLSEFEIQDYLGKNGGYGWHISDLVIYDEPKELWEFKTFCKSYYEGDNCDDCKYFIDCRGYEYDESDCGCNGLKPIERPPQSWQFVEEKEKRDDQR